VLPEGGKACAGLAFKKAAEPRRAETCFFSKLGEAGRAIGAGDETGGLGDGGVNVGARNGFAGKLVGLPGGDEGVIEGGVEEFQVGSLPHGAFVDLIEEIDSFGIDLAAKDVAGIVDAEDAPFALTRAAGDESGLEDDDPHGEVVRPVDEDVLLFWK